MITFRLKDLLEEQNISRYKLKKDTGLANDTVNGMFFNKTTRIELKIMNLLCNYLNCQPGDLFEYTKDKEH